MRDLTSEDQTTEVTTRSGFTLGIEIPVWVMPPIDVKAFLEEDERAMMDNIQKPYRFGYAIEVDIDIKKVGAKMELPDGGNLWLLKIQCPDAFSVNLIYDRFRLAKGSKFFVYNEDKSMVLGPYTPEESNNPYNEFATDLVQGDTTVLEYYEPESSDDGVIIISKVIHGYKNVFFSGGLGTSADCNVDVMCPLGDNWIIERRAVTLILVDNNTAFCSGCLVNNTRQDFTPYILTARHCYFSGNGNTQTSSPATSIFRFLYWKPNCGSGTPGGWTSFTGATLRAHHVPTDFALLELNTRPPVSWNLHYAGWDRNTTATQTATTGIHHPKGDAMKISREDHAVSAQNHPITGAVLSTWRVDHFEQGTLQPGSSGSPLFNLNKRIVGQLSVGTAVNDNNASACISTNRWGHYGRFDMSWTGGGTNASRLSNWLDPLGTAPATLNGMGGPFIDGPDVIGASCSATYTLGLPTSGVTSYSWSAIGGGVTPALGTGSSFTISRTSNLNDPAHTAIHCTFIFSGQTYSISKQVIARILPTPYLAELNSHNDVVDAQVGVAYYFYSPLPANQQSLVQQYQWELTIGGYVNHYSGVNTQNDPVTFPAAGTYSLRVRLLDGCEWSRWVYLNINVQ